ncbi:hypothetical protein B484DRAFT_438173, partial [Ochromonadaceae sp. CCMP2298]
VTNYGPLGASVAILGPISESGTGESGSGTGESLESYREAVDYFSALQGAQPQVGDILVGYVLKVRPNNKVDVSMRPVGYDKITSAKDLILHRLEQGGAGGGGMEEEGGADGEDGANIGTSKIGTKIGAKIGKSMGSLPLGDRSSPEDVWGVFPGMSKSQFKAGVGLLLRDGTVTVTDHELVLVAVGDRVVEVVGAYGGKSPKGWKAPMYSTVYVSNLPYHTTDMQLAGVVEK